MTSIGIAIVSALAAFVFYAGWLMEPDPLPEEPDPAYIDMHVHTAGIGAGNSEAFIGPAMRHSFKYPIYIRSLGVNEEELLKHGDGLILAKTADKIRESKYINQAVILGMDGVIDENGNLDIERTQFYVPNEFLMRELPKYPELMFGASINPLRPDSLERLDEVAANGAVLIKWIPNIMLFNPNDERFADFYRRMAEHCLPLLTHTGAERAFAGADDSLGDPERLRLALSLGVNVIAAHLGSTGMAEGEHFYDRLVRMLPEYPNLYSDISSLTQINKLGYLKRALRNEELVGRFIYGTDWPLHFFPLVSPYFQLDSISLRQAAAVRRLDNVWDRDVVLKQYMGVPLDAFRRFESIMPESCKLQREQAVNQGQVVEESATDT